MKRPANAFTGSLCCKKEHRFNRPKFPQNNCISISEMTQKLRRCKQRIGIFDARESGKKYSDLPKKSVDFVPVLW